MTGPIRVLRGGRGGRQGRGLVAIKARSNQKLVDNGSLTTGFGNSLIDKLAPLAAKESDWLVSKCNLARQVVC